MAKEAKEIKAVVRWTRLNATLDAAIRGEQRRRIRERCVNVSYTQVVRELVTERLNGLSRARKRRETLEAKSG